MGKQERQPGETGSLQLRPPALPLLGGWGGWEVGLRLFVLGSARGAEQRATVLLHCAWPLGTLGGDSMSVLDLALHPASPTVKFCDK